MDAAELGEQPEPVEPRQQQVEHDELVRAFGGETQSGRPVLGTVDDEAFGFEPDAQELENPRLVLDDENPHLIPPGADPTTVSLRV